MSREADNREREQSPDRSDEAAILGQNQAPRRAQAKFRADLVIFALWVFICAPQATGLGLHEWVSFAFVPFFVLHLLLSWKWIVKLTTRFFASLPARSRFNYLWNLILFALMVACIVSGVVVSEVALPGLGIDTRPDPFWGGLHDATANFLLLGLGVHLALHWTWIRGVFRSLRKGPKTGWREGVWREAVRPIPLTAILLAMSAVSVFALPLESSSWAEQARAERRAHAQSESGEAEAIEAENQTHERPAHEEAEKGEGRRRRFPPWARYVLPFVKQAVLMGVPALICFAILGVFTVIRRRRRG